MNDRVLRAMATAPRDGTYILAFHEDFAGAHILSFSDHDGDGDWFTPDGGRIGGDDCYAGWIDLPDDVRAAVVAAYGDPSCRKVGAEE